MNITKEQLDPSKKPKKIGKLHGVPVFELCTKGGLNIVCVFNGASGTKILGAGPHRGFARYLALQKESDLLLDELSKSEELDPRCFDHLIPYWANVVDKMNEKL